MPTVGEQVALGAYTTLGLGGPAGRFTEAGTEEQIVAAVRAADQAAEPVLVLGGGSNVVIADEGFDGTVVWVASRGVRESAAGGDADVSLTVAAGEDWDPLVERCVAEDLSGLECLSGIPGRAGATPIQNVGAYGQEVAAVITSVRVFDRRRGTQAEMGPADCGFGYRTSVFKREAHAAPTGRLVVLAVTFRLRRDRLSAPIRYAELAARLGVPLGDRVPLAEARSAVLGLRRGKGMVTDPADPDTRSAGSFFTNPVLDGRQLAELERRAARRSGPDVSIPRFPAGDGLVKVPAAWLIEQAGFGKGYPPGGRARISAKHTLALTNPGGATTADLLALAGKIIGGVHQAFGVDLVIEPVLVGAQV